MVTPSDIPRRRNGLSPPYSAPQVASWLFLAATAIEFGLLLTPIMPLEITIPLSAFFYLTIAVVLYYGMRVLTIDSMDVHLRKTLVDQRAEGVIKHEGNILNSCYKAYNGDAQTMRQEATPEGEETKQCWICDTQVAEHAMHCKYCNKCVSRFDHHCLWLNTCIGAKNYWDFFKVMLAIAFMQVVHLGISAGLVVDIFLHGPTEDRADKWLGMFDSASIAVSAVILFFISFDMCSLVLLAQLIIFHLHLQKEGITTYQYIIKDAQKRRDKAKRETDLEQQRMTEIARAQEAGQGFYVTRLQMGGQFRSCGCAMLDPLDLPKPAPEPDMDAGFAGALGGAPSNESEDDDVHEQPLISNGTNNSRYIDEPDKEEGNDTNGLSNPYQHGSSSYLHTTNNALDGMTNERHELDSQATQSELGDPEDLELNTPAKSNGGGLLGAHPRDDGDEDDDVAFQ